MADATLGTDPRGIDCPHKPCEACPVYEPGECAGRPLPRVKPPVIALKQALHRVLHILVCGCGLNPERLSAGSLDYLVHQLEAAAEAARAYRLQRGEQQ